MWKCDECDECENAFAGLCYARLTSPSDGRKCGNVMNVEM